MDDGRYPVSFNPIVHFLACFSEKYEINKTESLDFSFLQETPAIHSNRVEFLHKIIVLVILAVTLFCWLMSKWIGIPVAAASGIPIVGLTITGVLSEKIFANYLGIP